MTIDITIAPRRFAEEVINGHNLALIDELFAADYTNHSAPPTLPTGPAGERAFVEGFLTAFPDGHIAIEDVVAAGDKVAARGRFHGTHQGAFMGIPPTGRHFDVGVINIFRVREGKIVDNWSQLDMLGLLQQIGAIPAQG